MKRHQYSSKLKDFNQDNPNSIFGNIVSNDEFDIVRLQQDAWIYEIKLLQDVLQPYEGTIYFEYSIPRMGKRIDVVLLINSVIFVLEFKVGEKHINRADIEQVWDYALDLHNFHEPSHDKIIAPILIATKAEFREIELSNTIQHEGIIFPICCNAEMLGDVINDVLAFAKGDCIDYKDWENGRYCPTPTIIEAAMALYNGHNVAEISRNDASAKNLNTTTDTISEIILQSKDKKEKAICFVTGVPGAGKTLVGLNIATRHFDKNSELYSVFLSGNGPLVKVLIEALTRDRFEIEKEKNKRRKKGEKITKGSINSEVKVFIQNVHHFRDDCLINDKPPVEHVAIFDEAQRAWNQEKTTDFMKRKKGKPDFNKSEAAFLIECLERHEDWSVIICLVGGGQEIHSGEAGIKIWIDSILEYYPEWKVYISPQLTDSEYALEESEEKLKQRDKVIFDDKLHLAVSMRSYRAENVSLLVKQILDLEIEQAKQTKKQVSDKYPIYLTRSFKKGKEWVKSKASGTERYGMVVSSQALRMKPYAIDVRANVDPVHYFLNDKEDVRSSYYLEDVATEFLVQGLELDWVCMAWDADFRLVNGEWQHWSFKGNKWQHINKEERKLYLKNAYRVLLTRARQGMIIVVPAGDEKDHTRPPEFYNETFRYLKGIGFTVI